MRGHHMPALSSQDGTVPITTPSSRCCKTHELLRRDGSANSANNEKGRFVRKAEIRPGSPAQSALKDRLGTKPARFALRQISQVN